MADRASKWWRRLQPKNSKEKLLSSARFSCEKNDWDKNAFDIEATAMLVSLDIVAKPTERT